MEEKEGIELRSEKIQKIIGQIPSRIIRVGTSVIFIGFVVLFIVLFKYKFESSIKVEAQFYSCDRAVCGEIYIPIHYKDIVCKKQAVSCQLNKLYHLNSEISSIDTIVYCTNQKCYIKGFASFKSKIRIKDRIRSKVVIKTGKQSAVEYIFNKLKK